VRALALVLAALAVGFGAAPRVLGGLQLRLERHFAPGRFGRDALPLGTALRFLCASGLRFGRLARLLDRRLLRRELRRERILLGALRLVEAVQPVAARAHGDERGDDRQRPDRQPTRGRRKRTAFALGNRKRADRLADILELLLAE